ncbi:SWIM zinc finger family protein [Sinosporangium siamense]|uniref:SWIM zinc finger family protein n=1 Tax=Sinosporangium siamense TaxID=1367973 RepID=UPI001EF389FA|nr:SWIM zinc finger family protein [Sinosporangium siamense]
MIERWSRDQVLSLAPDLPSQKAAQSVARPGKWPVTGVCAETHVVWGECQGSGAKPYLACVDLSEPAYRCNCPSRKFPCKHALGLLLHWSAGGVPDGGEMPPWTREWLDGRRERQAKAAAQAAVTTDTTTGTEADTDAGRQEAAARRAEQREQRVTTGLLELERWLTDQVRQGVAGTRAGGHAHWDDVAKRLFDAQAPGMAGAVARLGGTLAEDDWPSRLLGEYALLYLLAAAHRGQSALPGDLAASVRSRVGFTVTREEVLAGETVRDHWDVLGRRDEEQDRLTARRVWLRGRGTGRSALVLSFAPIGQPLDASLVTGATVDADLAFYPGASPLRALVAARHAPPYTEGPPAGVTMAEALTAVSDALAGDPWLESWPLVLSGVVPARDRGWLLADAATGEGLPLHRRTGAPWTLIAVSGGHPVTVAAEWTPRGLVPLTTWDDDGRVVLL